MVRLEISYFKADGNGMVDVMCAASYFSKNKCVKKEYIQMQVSIFHTRFIAATLTGLAEHESLETAIKQSILKFLDISEIELANDFSFKASQIASIFKVVA